VEEREKKVDGNSVQVVARACMLAHDFHVTYDNRFLLM